MAWRPLAETMLICAPSGVLSDPNTITIICRLRTHAATAWWIPVVLVFGENARFYEIHGDDDASCSGWWNHVSDLLFIRSGGPSAFFNIKTEANRDLKVLVTRGKEHGQWNDERPTVANVHFLKQYPVLDPQKVRSCGLDTSPWCFCSNITHPEIPVDQGKLSPAGPTDDPCWLFGWVEFWPGQCSPDRLVMPLWWPCMNMNVHMVQLRWQHWYICLKGCTSPQPANNILDGWLCNWGVGIYLAWETITTLSANADPVMERKWIPRYPDAGYATYQWSYVIIPIWKKDYRNSLALYEKELQKPPG